jgi:hypothetical protein
LSGNSLSFLRNPSPERAGDPSKFVKSRCMIYVAIGLLIPTPLKASLHSCQPPFDEREDRMRPSVLVTGVLMLALAACNPAPSPSLPPTTTMPLSTTVSPTTVTPATVTPTIATVCEEHTSSTFLSVSSESLKVGDTVTVTVRLENEGCVGLGMPEYRLYIQSDGSDPIFMPDSPEPVIHYLTVLPGESDAVEFELTAVASGQAALTASSSFEVHPDYPGGAYWGYDTTGQSTLITVAP